jgi:hypothetical protein
MSLLHHSSCPRAVVKAPVAVVWDLLTEPSRWDEFFAVRIIAVTPPGPATVGQIVRAESGPRFLGLKLSFQYLEIEEFRHRLLIDVQLPFGVTAREDLTCIAIDADQCRVNYGCHFEFPRGLSGALLRLFLYREVNIGPADSLSRLKRMAEQIHANALTRS